MASSDVRTSVSTASPDATCPAASRRLLAAADRPPPVHVTVPDAGRLPSNAGAENEGLVFYEDHFSLDPLELCKLRFLSGDASVVDDLVEELEGSWQLILRPGEVLHPEGVLTVEGGRGLQCQDNTEEEDVSDAEEDVTQFPLLDQHLLQDSSSNPSMGGHHGRQPHSDGNFGQDELHQCCRPSGGGGQSERNAVVTGSTQSPEVAPHRRGVTGVAVCKADFFKHVTLMHASDDRSFQTEYSSMKKRVSSLPSVVAKANQHKNRYKDILTYDHSRVVLSVPDDSGSDYINASYIDGYKYKNAYIATQGPIPSSVLDFWQMIWDHKATVIVMLGRVVEGRKRKCEQYWREELHTPYNAGRNLSVITTKSYGIATYSVSHLKLTSASHPESPLYIKHYQYTGWPDHGVPLQPSSLVKFIQQVRKEVEVNGAPIVVHCSAGVGRTGTFITLDAMMERLKERDDLNIFEFVNEMRTRRMCMVQTVDQYMLIHDALCDYIMCGDTSVLAYEFRAAVCAMHKMDAKGQSGFMRQFEMLDVVSRFPDAEDVRFAEDVSVTVKNRHKDRCPYANSALYNGTTFVNATFMSGYSSRRAFIAAQAPMETTKTDVWEVIWQFGVSMIVLLCQLEEDGQESCCKFWPTKSEERITFGGMEVTYRKTIRQKHWDGINLSLTRSNYTRKMTLLHFKAWPKNGHPPLSSVTLMLQVMERMAKGHEASAEQQGPIVVMCNDGMSRSGVFITCMTEIERVKVEGGVDIFQTVKAARAQRPHMVNNCDQYVLCFEIIQSYLDSFDSYANFKAV